MNQKAISSIQAVRNTCYACYRPATSCMCKHITPLKTRTRFVILMHPKEFRKTKNGTGHFTNLSLVKCEMHIGIDFSQHPKINEILSDPTNACYVVYPSQASINLNKSSIAQKGKNTVLFLIDATWPCSKSMLAHSPNLNALGKVSFTHTKVSAFDFKKQPKEYCLSTMESAHCILELFNASKDETLDKKRLDTFLLPFQKMVAYQTGCA